MHFHSNEWIKVALLALLIGGSLAALYLGDKVIAGMLAGAAAGYFGGTTQKAINGK